MPTYLRPDSLDEALRALAGAPLTVIAGGTDFYPARVGKPLDDDVLDITRLRALRGISETTDHYRIGALTTWTEIIEAALPPWFDGLKQAAREVGGVQIQNAGTVAGNICNASPAADGVPALMSLDAAVELSAARGIRADWVAADLLDYRPEARAYDLVLIFYLQLPEPQRRQIFRAAAETLPGRSVTIAEMDGLPPEIFERVPANRFGAALPEESLTPGE